MNTPVFDAEAARVISPPHLRSPVGLPDILPLMRIASANARREEEEKTVVACRSYVSYYELLLAAQTPAERRRRDCWGQIFFHIKDAALAAAEAVHLESLALLTQQWLNHDGWKNPDWAPKALTTLREERQNCAGHYKADEPVPAEGTADYALARKYMCWKGARFGHIEEEIATVQQLEEFGAQLRDENLNFDMLEGAEDVVAVRCLALFYRNLLLGKKPT